MTGFEFFARFALIPVYVLAFAAAAQQPAEDSATAVLWQSGDPGERLFLRGVVTGPGGQALAGAVVSIRQTDGTGAYREDRYRAQLETAADGAFNIATVLPGQYMGPRHIHVAVSHDSYPALDIRIVFQGDPNLDQARAQDLPILLEEADQDGEKVWVGDVELVLGR